MYTVIYCYYKEMSRKMKETEWQCRRRLLYIKSACTNLIPTESAFYEVKTNLSNIGPNLLPMLFWGLLLMLYAGLFGPCRVVSSRIVCVVDVIFIQPNTGSQNSSSGQSQKAKHAGPYVLSGQFSEQLHPYLPLSHTETNAHK